MLNVFPELLTYTIFAPTLLRAFLVLFFLYSAWSRLLTNRSEHTKTFKKLGFPVPGAYVIIIGLIELAGAAFLLLGAYTQIAALVLAVWVLALIILKVQNPKIIKGDLLFYILLLLVLLSLLLSGAGGFALDLAI